MYETEVHNEKYSHEIMYEYIAQKLSGENRKLIFKMKNVNGKNKLVLKTIK